MHLGYGKYTWLSASKLPLKCAVVSLYSFLKQRFKCNTGKVCSCLIQFLLTMVHEKRIQHLFIIAHQLPERTVSATFLGTAVGIPINVRALFVSNVTRLSTVTIQLCLWVMLPDFPRLRYSFVCELCYQAFHGYDTALFVSYVTRLSRVTIQLCLWVTLPGFPRLRYSCVCGWGYQAFHGYDTALFCELYYQAFHGYDTAVFVSDVSRLSTVTIQLCLWRHKALFGCLVATDYK
jgi:hypothetical protein